MAEREWERVIREAEWKEGDQIERKRCEKSGREKKKGKVRAQKREGKARNKR